MQQQPVLLATMVTANKANRTCFMIDCYPFWRTGSGLLRVTAKNLQLEPPEFSYRFAHRSARPPARASRVRKRLITYRGVSASKAAKFSKSLKPGFAKS